VVRLIRLMARANVTWGAPRIRNELAKIGIEVAVSTVAKYMPRRRKPSSPTWRAFLENHLKDLVALDFFVVPTATFGVLFGLVVLAHHRRRVVHFNVTARPTAEWTARQVIQAFPEDTATRFVVRERDQIYGERFRHTMVVLDEVHLRRILGKYFECYNRTRCHLSLVGDAPEPREVQGPELGDVVELPEVGGLHHRYERAAA
jgi:transposase InsO family protein